MKKMSVTWTVIAVFSLLLASCGGATPTATQAPAMTEAPATEAPATEAPATEAPATEVPAGGDLLAAVLERGTLISFTDPAYPPQSALKESPERTEGTKCAEDQQTVGELEGFDIDVPLPLQNNWCRSLFCHTSVGCDDRWQLGGPL
jgi:ABC-type amino acid transport substrate-binding protein